MPRRMVRVLCAACTVLWHLTSVTCWTQLASSFSHQRLTRLVCFSFTFGGSQEVDVQHWVYARRFWLDVCAARDSFTVGAFDTISCSDLVEWLRENGERGFPPNYTLTLTSPLCIILVVMLRSKEFKTSRFVLMLIL